MFHTTTDADDNNWPSSLTLRVGHYHSMTGTVRVAAGAVEAADARPGLWLSVDNDGSAVDLEPYL